MAPPRDPVYAKDEKVLCFHHEFLYEAKVLDSKPIDPTDKKSPPQYRVHYKGWKNTWDDWVPQDRLRKFTDENKQLATQLKKDLDNLNPKPAKAAKKKAAGSDLGSVRDSEERQSLPPTGRKRGRETEIEKEEHFHARPAIKIDTPDHIKSILVDDWEQVTKNLALLPVPATHSVTEILTTYYEEERDKRRRGSAEADLLEEVVSGTKTYFEKAAGKMLFYRFERQQYFEVRQAMARGDEGFKDKRLGDIYGAEHLCRLFVSLPELVAQTNMDAQSVSKLRQEIQAIMTWLGKNSSRYFNDVYEVQSAEYIEKAKGQ